MQDTEFRKGFKFDHVWLIMKDFVKNFRATAIHKNTKEKIHEINLDSSQSDMPTLNTPTSVSTGLPSFEINLSSDDTAGGTSSQRPLGFKKSKLKKIRDENVLELISTMKEVHRDLLNVLQHGSTEFQSNYDIKMLAL
ncbi:hypothetical protein F511_36886 [Dorcoceras hygrometricum]|uniref:No apical meristem-associated C-terminal domain-containing protein n=1 Tax=Dorcoceras hygrometricum TaxID=472368 RepID=A0A2Z7BFU3_9LAMI|nr:hypothetical protein F511_36886 [Dorcoceras hygrometricum]